jgi:hypothetical protein
MKLTEGDKLSAVWQKLEPYLNDRLDACRKQNDGDLSPEQTAKLRGRISAYREILSLQNADSVQAEDDS